MKRIAMILVALAVLATAVRADVISANAGSGGVTKGTFVKLSAAGTIVTATAVGDSVVGVCEETASANALTKYALPGTKTVVTSGDVIAVGDLLTAGTGGKAFALDDSDTSDQRYAAVALTAASGADEDVTVVVVVGAAYTSTPPQPFVVIFAPTEAGTLTYEVPAGKKLRVIDAYGFKTVGAGAHADDELALQNNDGTAADIFAKEELNAVGDGSRFQFDVLVDAEHEVDGEDTLDLVVLEDAAGGCDSLVYVICIWVTP